MEQVTVSTAAQDAANTGQGAVQIRFATRSGSNNFSGSGYYYLQHYKLNANDWFDNRDLPPDPATGKAPKNEDVLYQPGGRVGGPIVIPGLWDGRNKASSSSTTKNRVPRAEQRNPHDPASAGGAGHLPLERQRRPARSICWPRGANGHLATMDPTICGAARRHPHRRHGRGHRPCRSDRSAAAALHLSIRDEGVTKYPTGRLDFNLSDKHRLSGSMNYTDLLSTPDTTNNREPNFPGFPGTGNQHSDRYTVQGTLRSTFTNNLVNEFRVGRSGGATLFSPEIGVDQFQGTSVADQGGFLLDINGDFLGITNAHSTGSYSAREAGTRILENTLSWLKGSHNIQIGGSFTNAVVWVENQQRVPTITFGVNTADPANGMFNTTNFPNASTAQLNDARELYATLVGRVSAINGQLRLDERRPVRVPGPGLQRARLRDGASSSPTPGAGSRTSR